MSDRITSQACIRINKTSPISITQLYGPHNNKKVNKEILVSFALQEDQFLCTVSLRFIVPCFSMVMDCIESASGDISGNNATTSKPFWDVCDKNVVDLEPYMYMHVTH